MKKSILIVTILIFTLTGCGTESIDYNDITVWSTPLKTKINEVFVEEIETIELYTTNFGASEIYSEIKTNMTSFSTEYFENMGVAFTEVYTKETYDSFIVRINGLTKDDFYGEYITDGMKKINDDSENISEETTNFLIDTTVYTFEYFNEAVKYETENMLDYVSKVNEIIPYDMIDFYESATNSGMDDGYDAIVEGLGNSAEKIENEIDAILEA